MTDEFLTEGLKRDRYLKATRLVDQFETEIGVKLRQVGQQMVTENPELFDADVEGSENTRREAGSALAYTRIDYPMARVRSPESDASLTLNVHLYWCDPAQYDRTDVDGALRAFGYKIKNATDADDERVVARTRDWPLQVAENPFGSSMAFYRHVSSDEEIEQTGEKLVEHFSTFGGEYGVARDE